MTNGEFITDVGATAAIVSPWWLPSLHQASETAGMILPLLGGLWLAVQIVTRSYQFWHTYFKK